MYDPENGSWQEGLPLDISKTLKRRYFLVEKAKNANVIGNSKKTETCAAPNKTGFWTTHPAQKRILHFVQ